MGTLQPCVSFDLSAPLARERRKEVCRLTFFWQLLPKTRKGPNDYRSWTWGIYFPDSFRFLDVWTKEPCRDCSRLWWATFPEEVPLSPPMFNWENLATGLDLDQKCIMPRHR